MFGDHSRMGSFEDGKPVRRRRTPVRKRRRRGWDEDLDERWFKEKFHSGRHGELDDFDDLDSPEDSLEDLDLDEEDAEWSEDDDFEAWDEEDYEDDES